MLTTGSRTEEELVHALVSGEHEAGAAWCELVERARPLLGCTLQGFRQRTGRGTLWEVDDLVQELYLHLSREEWQRLKYYQARPGVRFGSWLATVAYDLLLQKHRSRHRETLSLEEHGGRSGDGTDSLPSPGDTPEERFLRREVVMAVQQAIARLRHRSCQELIRRHCYLGETLATIAAEMTVSAAAARQMYRRNREELKGLLPSGLL